MLTLKHQWTSKCSGKELGQGTDVSDFLTKASYLSSYFLNQDEVSQFLQFILKSRVLVVIFKEAFPINIKPCS